MTAPTYNKLAARKIVGAITHLLTGKHQPIPADVLRRIIAAHLRELYAILPRKFGGLVAKLEVENDAGAADEPEFAAGLALILSATPITYGMLPAGAEFHRPGSDRMFRKLKGGVQGSVSMHPHPAASLVVIPL
jgi:hypothetical protein